MAVLGKRFAHACGCIENVDAGREKTKISNFGSKRGTSRLGASAPLALDISNSKVLGSWQMLFVSQEDQEQYGLVV